LQVSSELAEFSHEKRGMSPLIATMLLIAFAVALGALIINIGPKWFEGEQTPDCSNIVMEISPYFCYAENLIKLSIKNAGSPVESVTMKVKDDTGETTKLLPESKLDTGAVLQRDIPFLKSGPSYVGLTPSIKFRDEVVPCPKPAVEMPDLPTC
jgi:flagellin-like protein